MDAGASFRKLALWIRPEPLAAVILCGGIYPAAKVGLAEIPPLVFTYLRVGLATLVLAAVSLRARPASVSPDLRVALLGAGVAQAAFQLLLIAGLARTTAGTSAIRLAGRLDRRGVRRHGRDGRGDDPLGAIDAYARPAADHGLRLPGAGVGGPDRRGAPRRGVQASASGGRAVAVRRRVARLDGPGRTLKDPLHRSRIPSEVRQDAAAEGSDGGEDRARRLQH